MGKFTYKSYCWNFGTTSFRTENFNRTIELQLDLLDKFWKLPQHKEESWNKREVQEQYYDFLKENNFIKGDAQYKDKDARQKTSGLVDLGLIDKERKLTSVGKKALQISQKNDFAIDNALQISKDSFLYLKQLLKTSSEKIKNDGVVRPLLVTLYLLNKHTFLNNDEFTYLLPLCTNQEYTEQISNQIILLRQNKVSIDEIITQRLFSMKNYQEVLEWFLSCSNLNMEDFCEIGINRNGSHYDRPYFRVYLALKNIFLNNHKDENSLLELYRAIQNLKLKTWWSKLLFKNNTTERRIKQELDDILLADAFKKITNKHELRKVFLKTMHLFKAKATLRDYFDLNRRYLGLSDIFLFRDNIIELDIVPKYFFSNVINELYKEAFTYNDMLQNDCELNEISPVLVLDNDIIIQSINHNFSLNITSTDEARSILEQQRYIRFNKLIDDKFDNAKLIELLENFEDRDDKKIKEYVTNNAEVPTIFEYILGIIWYKVSDRKGKILDYMKLSLDSDLLPKSHAIGGEADIVYEYNQTENYPKHTLLLEATLADKTSQRRMELEPVSRHLGQHLLKNKNLNSYCIFATTHLDINVLSDFRNRKITPYYETSNPKNRIKGMKIIALQSSELKNIIKNNKKYNELYSIFDEAYKTDLEILEADEWYQTTIEEKLR